MTPQNFVTKWRDSTLKERAGAQEHFIDLCRMLGEKTPGDADAKGDWYTFEKGAAKTGGGDGWADVWKRNCFAWEYKGKGKNLEAALKQLKLYQGALDNPPLLIVSDMEKIEIHTAWTNMVQEKHVFTLDDLIDGRRRSLLKKAFSESAVEDLKPGKKRSELTSEVAQEFVALAQSLRERGHSAEKVAHFVNRMVFCMFAEDVDLLPDKLFKRMLEASVDDPDSFVDNAQKLFAAMAKPNGKLDFRKIEWFNGGLFDDENALPLKRKDIETALKAANQDWSNIDPSIMGTLFERGLDPDKRSQLGAHYTDPEKIMMIINPVIIDPLMREWEAVKAEITVELAKVKEAREAPLPKGANAQRFHQGQRQREENARRRERELFGGFLERLKQFRILDPACGSGNFLYLGLKALKDVELRANQDHEALSSEYDIPIGVHTPVTGPENMLGIEINNFAAELARVSVWIGEIQWMREHGFDATRNPILKSLENIVHHDALLNEDGTEYEWPAADVIIGNPPFLGGKIMRNGRPARRHRPALAGLGDKIVDQLFEVYNGRVSAEADFVCYWFAKAREQLEEGLTRRVGLVATNSIRSGASREVLDHVAESGRIFEAWSDEPWVVDGAAVRVSIVCFDAEEDAQGLRLDGKQAGQINPDLTASATDLTKTARLRENGGMAFMGDSKGGAFDVAGVLARKWLQLPTNPNGQKNGRVLRPWINGADITKRPADKWIIDFGWTLTEEEAAMFEAPFAHITTKVKPKRVLNNRELYAKHWWRHVEPRQGMWAALQGKRRYLATVRHSKHRLFRWFDVNIVPDSALIVVASELDAMFGLLQSRMHEAWSLGLCSWLGVGNDPRYTPSTTFETYPFPKGLTPDVEPTAFERHPSASAIAAAAKQLNELREAWLNPADLVRREPEVVAGYPHRILPASDAAAKELKGRTLTRLYNDRPAWLENAHRDLDCAVATAYGWDDWGQGLSDDEILKRLFALNQERATDQLGV